MADISDHDFQKNLEALLKNTDALNRISNSYSARNRDRRPQRIDDKSSVLKKILVKLNLKK